MPKFSIVTPTWLNKKAKENERQPRYEMFLRCAHSVFAQTFTDFEWIIVDDMSEPPVEEILESLSEWWGPKGLNVKIIRLDGKQGRIGARNVGIQAATGEWITWLDSDDEYSSIYLEAMNDAIRVYPEYKMFNFNHLVFHHNYNTTVRSFMNMEVQGDAPFGSGNVGAGSFIFKRELLEGVEYLPVVGLWDFRDWFFERYPEVMPFFESSSQPGKHNSLGNPWGEDYVWFYQLTRKAKCKYLNTALYFVHSRFNHRWDDDVLGEANPGSKPEYNPENI